MRGEIQEERRINDNLGLLIFRNRYANQSGFQRHLLNNGNVWPLKPYLSQCWNAALNSLEFDSVLPWGLEYFFASHSILRPYVFNLAKFVAECRISLRFLKIPLESYQADKDSVFRQKLVLRHRIKSFTLCINCYYQGQYFLQALWEKNKTLSAEGFV